MVKTTHEYLTRLQYYITFGFHVSSYLSDCYNYDIVVQESKDLTVIL
jgi:hypothetical protein